MKYVKIPVPDDFDRNTHQVVLHTPIKNVNYPDEPDFKLAQVEVWQPQYREMLDKGFVGLVDFMGGDHSVVNAARVSYGEGTRRVSEDRNLIRYLMRHRHSTPFEMVETLWHVRLPIFVCRQWIRHRTASVNEYSGRYSVMTDDTYMPDISVLKPQSSTNKQGRSGEMSEKNAYACQLQLQHIYHEAQQAYHYLLGDAPVPSTALNTRYDIVKQFAMDRIKWLEANDPAWKPDLVTEEMIDDKIKEIVVANGLAFTDDEFWGEDGEGLSRELARIGLTLATYTEMYWKCDLKNTFNFISLRSDPHAQHEIKVYSDAMLEMLEPITPICIQAFVDYQMHGRPFSSMELQVVRELYRRSHHGDNEDFTLQADRKHDIDQLIENIMTDRGAGKREVKEFIEALERA